ncbi:MAG: IclR family transcriptional regulator [Gammaproteobacteria bacterium]|nr:IclR family transcriptional regulator [Gammaproteobacteria bacterium]MBU1442165.1 IclR family transcriptional regulator [Gammaproteobacteria bacterium]MBU2288055.1 IclR family transcriptional regulator [Gammaproteobacteria bacterium]
MKTPATPVRKAAAAPKRKAAPAKDAAPTAKTAGDGTGASESGSPRPPSGVLERGLSILECFSEDRLRLQLRELAECTGLDKATLLRLLGVLVRARMVHRFDNGSYAPGPALLHMGMLYRRTFDVGSRLQPALLEVMRQTGETVAFYVRDGDERVCLYRENSSNEVRHHVEVGTRLKLSAGGSSSHVLRYFTGGSTPQADAIARDGFAITREERVPQIASVAVPVFDSDGVFQGALVVIGIAPRQSASAQRKAVQVARQALAKQGFGSAPPKAGS